MIYVVYFVPLEGAHPHASLDLYKRIWPIMHKSVHAIGGKLVHLTDLHTERWGDSAFRVDVDSQTTIYSRDVAWLEFLRKLPTGEQACMIEPDTLMLKPVPPIADGFDMALLRRPEKCVPGWFKLATNRAVPFYERVMREWDSLTGDLRVFHGDIGALHRACGIADGDTAHTIPSLVEGVRIEVREWHRYGFRKSPQSDPYFLQFKGTSKEGMLKHA